MAVSSPLKNNRIIPCAVDEREDGEEAAISQDNFSVSLHRMIALRRIILGITSWIIFSFYIFFYT